VHVQPTLRPNSFLYKLVELTSYITFTVIFVYVLYAQPSNLEVNLTDCHTQHTNRTNSILLAQQTVHHYSLHNSLAEWSSYMTSTVRFSSVLHDNSNS